MKTKLNSLLRWLGLSAGLVLAVTCRGAVPEPDNIAYGRIFFGTNRVTAKHTNVVVEVRNAGDTNVLASYRMGQNPDFGSHYVVPIRVGVVQTGVPTTTNGSLLNLIVKESGIERARTNFVVGGPGAAQPAYVQRIDFGSNTLTGFDAWLAVYELDSGSGVQDLDHDGSSNWQEYLAGTNPTNAASQFRLRIAPGAPNATVSFDALRAEGAGYEGLARHYALERVGDPSRTDWQTVPNFADVLADNQTVTYTTATASGPAFYRGKIWLGSASEIYVGDFRLWMSRTGGQTMVTFTTLGADSQGRNRYYTLEYCTNLTSGAWYGLPGCSNVLGNLQTVTHTITNLDRGPGFYRARLELRSP